MSCDASLHIMMSVPVSSGRELLEMAASPKDGGGAALTSTELLESRGLVDSSHLCLVLCIKGLLQP